MWIHRASLSKEISMGIQRFVYQMCDGGITMNPSIEQVIKNINFADIANNFSFKNLPDKEEKRLFHWSRRSNAKYGYDEDILKVAVLLAMRTKKDHDIPVNNYLYRILDNFKKFNVETLEDAIVQYKARITFELEKLENEQEIKKYYSHKKFTETLKRL